MSQPRDRGTAKEKATNVKYLLLPFRQKQKQKQKTKNKKQKNKNKKQFFDMG